jgi:hypothetical protein
VPERPDALILPADRKAGVRMSERVRSICGIAEPLLGVDRGAGERAWIRQQPHGCLFITRDNTDTMLFPLDHPRAGQPRYRWVRQPDGVEVGYLARENHETR